MRRSRLLRKPLLISILVLAIGYCILGVGTIFHFGFADFPCFVDYDEQSNCIQSDPEMDYLDINQYARIQVFLTVHDVRFAGGGCNYENSNNDQLNAATSVLNLKFEREGDTLKVNGKLVPAGGENSHTPSSGI